MFYLNAKQTHSNKQEGEPDIRGSHSGLWDIPGRGPAQPLSPDRKTTSN